MNENQTPKSVNIAIPLSIIVAGILIAGAIIWQKPATDSQVNDVADTTERVLDPVSNKDHILGNPNAPIKIVEYSDTSCPFCKLFHPTMRKIMEEYGKSGQVAWVYRHYPIAKLHPNAELESQALECAAELGGNDGFWSFTHRLYEVNTAAGQNSAGLESIAKYVNINTSDFNKCLSSGKYASKVEAHITSGFKAGVAGTPTSFITYGTDSNIPIEGAQDYAHVKSAIDIILKQRGN